MLPVAIQIELEHCDRAVGVRFSPFTCAYYLMFLNYHELGQYDDRDRALLQLINVINSYEHCGVCTYHSLNIAGHCLLSMGKYTHARDLFIQSFMNTYIFMPSFHPLNSAQYYLRYLLHCKGINLEHATYFLGHRSTRLQ